MKTIFNGTFPYSEYKVYLVYHKKMKRWMACLVNATTKERHTISHARYVMSVKAKRILEKDEHVDHIDGDKLNNSISNLQILKMSEHNKKSAQESSRKRWMVEIKCPSCGRIFKRSKRQTHLVKGGNYTACSRKCSGKLGAQIQHKTINCVNFDSSILKIFQKGDQE